MRVVFTTCLVYDLMLYVWAEYLQACLFSKSGIKIEVLMTTTRNRFQIRICQSKSQFAYSIHRVKGVSRTEMYSFEFELWRPSQKLNLSLMQPLRKEYKSGRFKIVIYPLLFTIIA